MNKIVRFVALAIVMGGVCAARAVNYTWTGAGEANEDGSRNWSDPLNWGKTAENDFPGKAASDYAIFPAAASAKVRIDVSKTIQQITASATGLDLTFVRDDNCVLQVKGQFSCGTANTSTQSGSIITLDGAVISAANSPSYVDTTARLMLKNAAELTLKSLRVDSRYAYEEGLVEVSGGSTLTLCDTGTAFAINDGGRLVVDDSTIDIKGNAYVNIQNKGGGRILVKGANPKILVAGANFCSENNASRTLGTDFDFLVPAEGWTEAPIQHLSESGVFLDGAPSCPAKMRFNVLPDSPVFTSRLTADIPLISAASGMLTSAADFAAIRYAPGNNLVVSPDTKTVTLQVKSVDCIVRVGASKVEGCGHPQPSYGYHALAAGRTTFTFNDGTYAVGSTSVTGARVYSVDPDTGVRTEISGSPFAGRSFVCDVGGGLLDVVWEYDWTSAFANTVYVKPDGNDANDGMTWETAVASLTNAVDKIDSGAVVFADGRYECLNYPTAVSLSKPVTITSVNGREVTELFFRRTAKVRALTVGHADAVVSGLAFASDLSNYGMGCLEMTAGLVTNCTVRGFGCERASSNGLAITLSGGTVADCVMTNNYLNTSGGSGAWGIVRLTKSAALVDRCVVADNTQAASSAGSGAAVGVDASGAQVRNTLIARNVKPGLTSGLSVVKGGIVDNCTIVGNKCLSATAYGGVSAAAGAIIRNSIIYGNMNMNGEANFTSCNAAAISNCCSTDDLTANGTGNVVAEPEFVDYDGGDYHLASGACLNGGAVLDWMGEGAVDLDGASRILGRSPDIGCYETAEGALMASAVSSAVYGVDSLDVTFTAAVSGAHQDGLVYSWYLTGADTPDASGADKASVDWKYASPGVYSIRLVVTNGMGERAEAFYEEMITVSPKTVYVSKNSTPTRPYGSWATAAASVQDALRIAGDGTTVVVGDGVYVNDETIVVTKDVNLVSQNGSATTVMTRNARGFRLLDVGCSTAVVSGFTFRQETFSAETEGLAFSIRSGCITNCVFRDIYCDSGYASVAEAGGGLIVDTVFNHCRGYYRTSFFTGGGTTFDRCAFTGNVLDFTEYGGFANEATLTFRNCLFAGNRCSDSMEISHGALITVRKGAVLENCTIADNDIPTAVKSTATTMRPAVAGDGTVRNCIICGNTNPFGTNDVATSVGVTYTLSGNAALAGTNGNVCEDPKFLAPTYGDYRLRNGSPAIDAGEYSAWMANALDLRLKPRIYNADKGGLVDMGCYEKHVSGLIVIFH